MNPSQSPRRAGRGALSFLLAGCLLAALALAAGVLPRRVAYLIELARAAGPAARGAWAASETVSPYATAGQVEWRRELDRPAARGAHRRSGLALAWTFFVAHRDGLGDHDRVYLAVPNDALYFYGNFLWSPARLEVAPPPFPPLATGADLARASTRRRCSERDALVAEGYAGCIDAAGGRLELVRFGTAPGPEAAR